MRLRLGGVTSLESADDALHALDLALTMFRNVEEASNAVLSMVEVFVRTHPGEVRSIGSFGGLCVSVGEAGKEEAIDDDVVGAACV